MSRNIRRPSIFMMDLWATVPYYTAYLSKALLAEGADVIVGSISYYLDPTCFTSRGIQLDPGLLDIVGKHQLPRGPRRALKLLEALLNMAALTIRFLSTPPDILHVQYLPMLRWPLPLDYWFVRLCQRRGSKVVLTVHDLLPHNTSERYKRKFQHLYSAADHIICHSDHIKQKLVVEFNVLQGNVTVIPHGPFFYDLPVIPSETASPQWNILPDQLVFLWQGIIFPYKGLDLLLSAWREVEAQIEHTSLVIAGTGAPDLLAEIRSQVRQLGLERVQLDLRFLSAEELVALYRASDVVVYPYRAITTSGALATGLALGKTIVASDLPVFRELLHHRENALLVNPQNTAELSAALIELAQNSRLRHTLATNVAKMNFGDQSWLDIARKTLRVYDNFLHTDVL